MSRTRSLVAGAAGAALLLGLAGPAAADRATMETVARAVGMVVCYGPNGEPVGTGTGFVAGDSRTLVTNHHVVHYRTGGRAVPCARVSVAFSAGPPLTATVKVAHEALDLAVLDLDAAGPAPLPLFVGDAQTLRGEPVRVVGYPGFSNLRRMEGASGAVSWRPPSEKAGIVSSVSTDPIGRTVVETDAAINGGNSGGPVVDLCGRVIGVATFKPMNVIDVEDAVKIVDGKPVMVIGIEEGVGYAVSALEVHQKALGPLGAAANALTTACDATPAGALGAGAADGAYLAPALVIAALALVGLGVTLAALRIRRRGQPATAAAGGGGQRAGWAVARREGPAGGRAVVGPTTFGRAFLEGQSGPARDRTFELTTGDHTIGRDPDVCTTVLPPDTKSVSRLHAIVRVAPDGTVRVLDNASSAGTFVDGRKIERGEWAALRSGSVLDVGTANVRYRLERR